MFKPCTHESELHNSIAVSVGFDFLHEAIKMFKCKEPPGIDKSKKEKEKTSTLPDDDLVAFCFTFRSIVDSRALAEFVCSGLHS